MYSFMGHCGNFEFNTIVKLLATNVVYLK